MADYTDIVLSLFPEGRAWPRLGNLRKFAQVIAAEVDRCIAAAELLLLEFSARTSTQMLTEYETLLGLSAGSLNDAQRRTQILGKLNAVGGQSKEYFLSIAESLGYHINSTAVDPHLRIADGLNIPFRLHISQLGIDKLFDQGAGNSIFTWQIIGTNVEDSNNVLTITLKKLMNQLKPAHTEIIYTNE